MPACLGHSQGTWHDLIGGLVATDDDLVFLIDAVVGTEIHGLQVMKLFRNALLSKAALDECLSQNAFE
jgi:hypothetical protein